MAAAENWYSVGAADTLGEGEMLGTEAGGQYLCLYKVEGCVYATSDICTHEHVHLSQGGYLEGKVIECPLHAGQFDVTTGQGLGPPLTSDIRTFPVRVVKGTIEVCVPDGE